MKKLQSLKDLNKDQLINELMTGTIKGGCCDWTDGATYDLRTGKYDDDLDPDTVR